jgi:hypothetical protein
VKRSHGVLAVGLIVSAWLAIFGDKTPSEPTSEPVARPGKPATAAPARTVPAKPEDRRKRSIAILALQPRAALIGRNGTGRSSEIFAQEAVAPPPPPPAPAEVPAAAPSLPPLPFTYLGKKYENAKWEVYLGIGDQTYFVREGSVIEQNYAVNSIRPPTMTLTYLPLKQLQTLTIGGVD